MDPLPKNYCVITTEPTIIEHFFSNHSILPSSLLVKIVNILGILWCVHSIRNNQSFKDEEEQFFSQEDWEQLNKFIGYKEEENSISIINASKEDALLTSLEVHMNRNASKLTDEAQHCLAELSCKNLNCSMKFFPETKVFDINLGSYQLSSPSGLLAVV